MDGKIIYKTPKHVYKRLYNIKQNLKKIKS